MSGAAGTSASGGTGASSGGTAPAGGAPGASAGQGGANSGGAGGDPDPAGGTAGAGAGGAPSGARITISGRRLLVDGKPFHIRGVNWNPVPKGRTHPEGLDYAGFADRDIALMKAAGINAVRTYERLDDRTVLDKLHAAGIYVFSTVYGWWQDDPSVVTERVNAVKDHPAILAWVIGNEWNYNKLYSEGSRTPALTLVETRDQLNRAAAAIRAADDTRPISTIYGEIGGIAETIQAMPLIDLWGINTYRGISHGDLFTAWAAISDKPMYLGEYGADAYDSRNGGKVDTASQALAVKQLTQEIIDNYTTESGGITLGGFVFEWADEWWKAPGSPDVQDTGGVGVEGGPYPDSTFNEEFWGIVDIDRDPRPAYDELKALYTQ